MADLDHSDLERQANLDLTTPNGEALAQALINAETAWAPNCCGYTFAKATFVGFFDGGMSLYFLKTTVPSKTPSRPPSANGADTSATGGSTTLGDALRR